MMTNFNTYRHPSTVCSHCNGSIILKYDRAYCIQCSRPVQKTVVRLPTEAEYKTSRKAEKAMLRRVAEGNS
jgi:hypothetical protein